MIHHCSCELDGYIISVRELDESGPSPNQPTNTNLTNGNETVSPIMPFSQTAVVSTDLAPLARSLSSSLVSAPSSSLLVSYQRAAIMGASPSTTSSSSLPNNNNIDDSLNTTTDTASGFRQPSDLWYHSSTTSSSSTNSTSGVGGSKGSNSRTGSSIGNGRRRLPIIEQRLAALERARENMSFHRGGIASAPSALTSLTILTNAADAAPPPPPTSTALDEDVVRRFGDGTISLEEARLYAPHLLLPSTFGDDHRLPFMGLIAKLELHRMITDRLLNGKITHEEVDRVASGLFLEQSPTPPWTRSSAPMPCTL
jgi:hypothetical protein